MHLRKIAQALFACLAITAVSASGAQAQWTIGEEGQGPGRTLAELGIASEKVEVTQSPGTDFTLTAEIGSTKIEITAKTLECTPGVECTIDENVTEDHGTGRLTFTEVEVVKPASCKEVSSPGAPIGTVTLTPVTDKVIMDPSGGEATFDEFFPQTGTTFVELEFPEGPLCPFAELAIPIGGSITARVIHGADEFSETGKLYVEQKLLFNQAQQETGGGELYLAGNKADHAYLDGTAVNTLIGPNKGKAFGAD